MRPDGFIPWEWLKVRSDGIKYEYLFVGIKTAPSFGTTSCRFRYLPILR
jgi:hypothetical protein